MSRSNFIKVTHAAPCPACGKPDWCAWTTKGWLKCERVADAPPGMALVKLKHGGALFMPVEGMGSTTPPQTQRGTTPPTPARASVAMPSASVTANDGPATSTAHGPQSPSPASQPNTTSFSADAERFRLKLTIEQRDSLARTLGVAPRTLDLLHCGWASQEDLRGIRASGKGWKGSYPDGAFTFPERDAKGRVIGLSLRAADGRKGAPSGANRGLVVPTTLKDLPDPVLLVEGASDVAACLTLGLAAVGRPSNTGGAELVAELLDGRDVLVVGERDQKEDGAWPGRDGARSVAKQMVSTWDGEVKWTLPPSGTKDVRSWLTEKIASGLDVNDSAAMTEAACELSKSLFAESRSVKSKQKSSDAPSNSATELLVQLATEHYRFGRTEDDEPFAVRKVGPNVALMLNGSSEKLKSQLARDFRATHGRTVGVTAMGNAMMTLGGMALGSEAEKVHLRLAQRGEEIVIDMGTADGRAVVITPDGWTIVPTSPVLFRRSALTAAMPEPARGGSVELLRELLNISDDAWQLCLGWLIASIIKDVPHPILLLGGGQGSGKTTASRLLVDLFDPSTVASHNQPRDPESWAMAANGSWCVVVDNISAIPDWWSDAMCKCIYGAGWVRRKLYTDSGLAVINVRCVVVLTSIDAGALRGDLGDRMLIVDLERIPDSNRREQRLLNEKYAARRPLIMGALFDLVAKVLRARPLMHPAELPRLADFGVVLAAMDHVLGTSALSLYMNQRNRIADDVVGADPVGDAVLTLAHREQVWSGTCQQLLDALHTERPPKGWPSGPRGLAGRLRRLAPDLKLMGVEVIQPAPTKKTRVYIIRLTAQTAQPPEKCRPRDGHGASDQAVPDLSRPDRPDDRPIEAWPEGFECWDSGRSGGSGGYFPISDDRASERVVGEVDS